ncbi:MAG TPA: PQQ-dependent sugar dehydrogenase [Micropruina sp.]|nr:PQQ-dependent sugar dehydrogenase [Micropruina sp.]
MVSRLATSISALVALVLTACTASPAVDSAQSSGTSSAQSSGASSPSQSAALSLPAASPMPGTPFAVQPLGAFDEPWALAFLPGGFDALVTERRGTLVLRHADGRTVDVEGVPTVAYGGQGGLGDVIVSPTFATDRTVYLSWAASGEGGTGAEVGRGRLVGDGTSARLENFTVIWRQQPKVDGSGHFGHRLAFSPDGEYLFVTSGERQKMSPAQDLTNNLGSIVRLNPDGTPAAGNPFADRGGVAAEIWTYGHRNPLGLAFDASGNLWSSEMGPQGGDELNLVVEGRNYGWPQASNGSHYGGAEIPDHREGDGFEAPKVWWNPSISPGSLMIYSGTRFPAWRGDAFLPALSGQGLARVDLQGTTARKADEWNFGARVRAVGQAPDGSLWVLEDGGNGRLLRLTRAG